MLPSDHSNHAVSTARVFSIFIFQLQSFQSLFHEPGLCKDHSIVDNKETVHRETVHSYHLKIKIEVDDVQARTGMWRLGER